jgi:regulatory protein
MKIIENFESTNKFNIEKLKEFDAQKTKVFKYITYKKRTEQEVRNKFRGQIEEQMLDEIIEYLKEAKYLDDEDFIEKQVREYTNLKTMSIKELKYKLYAKGLDRKLVEQYIEKHYDELKEYEEKCIEKIRNKRAGDTEEEINQYLYRKGYKCD